MNLPSGAAARRPCEPDALSRASTALWLATVSLMTAYMHTAAPAHRYLLAARIARNFGTLREHDCFSSDARATFSRLALHWREKADALSPYECRRSGPLARIQRLISGG